MSLLISEVHSAKCVPGKTANSKICTVDLGSEKIQRRVQRDYKDRTTCKDNVCVVNTASDLHIDELDVGDGIVRTETPSPACGNPKKYDFAKSDFVTVFACGDFHGDYAVFQACMLMTGCASIAKDRGLEWIPTKSRMAVVMLGDLVDRQRSYNSNVGEFKNEEHMILRTANKLAAQVCDCTV